MNIDDDAFVGKFFNSTTAPGNSTNAVFASIASSAREAKAWGVGVNWYVNNYMRFALDYEQTGFEGGGGGTITNNSIVTSTIVDNWKDRQDERTMIGRLQVSF
jgi:phosphate-selective porin OprO/OprP